MKRRTLRKLTSVKQNAASQACYEASGSRDHTAPSEVTLDELKWNAVLSGRFPADISDEVIHLKTTESQFRHMRQAFCYNEDIRQPKVNLNFNTRLLTTTVYRTNTAIHQAFVSVAQHQLMSDLLPIYPDFGTTSDCRCESIRHPVDPQVAGRLPIPDLQITYTNEAAELQYEPIFALEVGFSQPSKDLKASVRTILETFPLVKTAILVAIKETPMYKNPLRKAKNADVLRHAMQKDPTSWSKEPYVQKPGDIYGPIWRFGIRWVGTLNATAQVWTKDAESGKVVAGDHINFYGDNAQENRNIELKLNDFVPSDDPIFKRSFAFDSNQWRKQLANARWGMANNRFTAAIKTL